ncbi:MAG: DUF1614 domain-containing protein [Candidatus Njordarchaeia archaeon]
MSPYRKKPINYYPFPATVFLFYLFLLLMFIFPLFSLLFSTILGLPVYLIELIILLSLLGSSVNIPVFTMKRYVPVVTQRVVSFMGIPWIVPELELEEEKTIIAINLGGCIIPVILSLYIIIQLITIYGLMMFGYLIIAIIIDSLLINAVAKPIPGVGIATPSFLPPLFTAIVTIILSPVHQSSVIFAFAYAVGTLSALIGADLMNLKKIPKLGAPVASIGGAGTFDGIFLTGLVSILFLI